MIHLTRDTPVLLGLAPADFRCGIDGFAARCRTLLGREPSRGTLHVFINRRATMIRVLVHDGTGFWLMTKRLSKGRFEGWPRGAEDELSAASARALRALLESGSWQGEPAAGRHAHERAALPRSCPAPPPTTSSLS